MRDRRQAWNAWRHSLSLANKLEYRRLDAICATVLADARRKAWSAFVSSLSSTSSSRIWRFLSTMKGRASSFTFPLQKDGVALLTDLSKADFLASFFSSTLSVPVPLPALARFKVEVIQAMAAPSPPGLSLPFTSSELSSAVSALPPRKAVGPDLVPYEFLRALPSASLDLLLEIYNQSWSSGSFPTAWKMSTLLPFPKPGKDLSSPSGYRPIVLLQCVGKLLERLVCTRLRWWTESWCSLVAEQCGFHQGRGTIDVLLQLEHAIHDTYRSQGVMLALFLDITGAFDYVSHLGILYKLSTMGVTGLPLSWFSSFLNNRTSSISVGGAQSAPFVIRRGVPQGSVLSPLLFNVLLSDLPRPPATSLLVYTDNLALI